MLIVYSQQATRRSEQNHISLVAPSPSSTSTSTQFLKEVSWQTSGRTTHRCSVDVGVLGSLIADTLDDVEIRGRHFSAACSSHSNEFLLSSAVFGLLKQSFIFLKALCLQHFPHLPRMFAQCCPQFVRPALSQAGSLTGLRQRWLHELGQQQKPSSNTVHGSCTVAADSSEWLSH